jgi:hypothetical protein
MKNIPGYYATAEAAKVLGMSKTSTEDAARREGWTVYKVGNAHLHPVEDVREYRDHRLRTRLVKKLGWRGRGLYRVSDVDVKCPVCGGFAVGWPAPPEIPIKFMCLEGHEGERDVSNL